MSRFSRIYSVRAQATPLAVLIRTYVGSSAGLQFLGHPAMTQKWPVVSQTPASGKHLIIFQSEPHKCLLMRRRLSPRIYPARSIRLTSEPLRVATPCCDYRHCEGAVLRDE